MLQSELGGALNIKNYLQTIRNCLRKRGNKDKVVDLGPRLTIEHCVVRIEFTRNHVNWDIVQCYIF